MCPGRAGEPQGRPRLWLCHRAPPTGPRARPRKPALPLGHRFGAEGLPPGCQQGDLPKPGRAPATLLSDTRDLVTSRLPLCSDPGNSLLSSQISAGMPAWLPRPGRREQKAQGAVTPSLVGLGGGAMWCNCRVGGWGRHDAGRRGSAGRRTLHFFLKREGSPQTGCRNPGRSCAPPPPPPLESRGPRRRGDSRGCSGPRGAKSHRGNNYRFFPRHCLGPCCHRPRVPLPGTPGGFAADEFSLSCCC